MMFASCAEASAQAPAEPPGPTASPERTREGQLSYYRTEQSAVHAFLADAPGDAAFPRVADQVDDLMGVPEAAQTLADGRILITGCRPRDCLSKAAVLENARGDVLAVGLITKWCQSSSLPNAPTPSIRCEPARLVVIARLPDVNASLLAPFLAWAGPVTDVARFEVLDLNAR